MLKMIMIIKNQFKELGKKGQKKIKKKKKKK